RAPRQSQSCVRRPCHGRASCTRTPFVPRLDRALGRIDSEAPQVLDERVQILRRRGGGRSAGGSGGPEHRGTRRFEGRRAAALPNNWRPPNNSHENLPSAAPIVASIVNYCAKPHSRPTVMAPATEGGVRPARAAHLGSACPDNPLSFTSLSSGRRRDVDPGWIDTTTGEIADKRIRIAHVLLWLVPIWE